jgi:ribosomal protein L37AE/L43A
MLYTETDLLKSLSKKSCEICGYQLFRRISTYPDGIRRCHMCANKAAYGRHITDKEVENMPSAQIEQLLNQFDRWREQL